MLNCNNITLTYDRHPVVHHVTAQFAPGSFTAIVGPNGAGKSSLLRAIAGEAAISEGQISNPYANHYAYMPQQPGYDSNFPMTVFNLVAAGAWRETDLLGSLNPKLKQRVNAAIHRVGLEGFERRQLQSLSGGQLQRALFARVIMQNADLILLDEPFSAVDERTQQELIAICKEWQAQNKIVLAVIHNIAMVKAYVPRTLLIARHLIAHGDTAAVLTAANLEQARQLREAFDDFAEQCQQAI